VQRANAASAISLVLVCCGTQAFAQRHRDSNHATSRPSVANDARQAFDRGLVALRDGRYNDALIALEESQRLRPSPVVTYNLGLVHRALGHYVEAIDAFQNYLDAPEEGADSERIRATRTAVLDLQRSLVTLLLDVEPPAARVSIDGRVRSVVSAGLTLDPGHHVVEVNASGFSPYHHDVTLSPGGTEHLTIRLAPLTGVDHSQSNDHFTLSPWFWIGAAVAVASAAGATGVWIHGNFVAQQYDANCQQMPQMLDCRGVESVTQNDLNVHTVVIYSLWGATALGAVIGTIGLVGSLAQRNTQSNVGSRTAHATLALSPMHAGLRVTW
jgi:hypothetical protein